MSLLQRTLTRLGLVKTETKTVVRSLDGGQINRLTSDWLAGGGSADAEIKPDLQVVIRRARQMERDDDYIRSFLGQLENNIIGEYGIGLQAKALNPDRSFDTLANNKVEQAWNKNMRTVGINGESLVSLSETILRRAATDGGVLVRLLVRNSRLKIQLIEIDQLDLDYSGAFGGGRYVVMGVERDSTGSVIAYHVFKEHPGDTFQRGGYMQRERIPAAEIIHVTKRERIGQTHGFCWFQSALVRMRNIRGYENAEIIAARLAACKGAVLETQTPIGYDGSETENQIENVEPGSIQRLNPGEKYVSVDPTHPNDVFPQFIKSQLRGAAAGMEVAYTSLANDLESVNYSSQRGGLIVERDAYKKRQRWFIETFFQPLFDAWLPLAILSGDLVLPMSKLEKFSAIEWKPRRWPWIDPSKDMAADVMAVEKGFKSRREIISDAGGDVEDVFQSIAEDQKLAEKLGVNFPIGQNPQGETATVEENPDEEGTDESGTSVATSVSKVAQSTSGSGDVQDTALNGAQITALLELAQAVAAGQMPSEAGMAIAQAAFPLVPKQTFEKIFASLKNFKPKVFEAKEPT